MSDERLDQSANTRRTPMLDRESLIAAIRKIADAAADSAVRHYIERGEFAIDDECYGTMVNEMADKLLDVLPRPLTPEREAEIRRRLSSNDDAWWESKALKLWQETCSQPSTPNVSHTLVCERQGDVMAVYEVPCRYCGASVINDVTDPPEPTDDVCLSCDMERAFMSDDDEEIPCPE